MLEPVIESVNPEMNPQHHRGVEAGAALPGAGLAVPGTPALPDLLLVERARAKEVRAFETLMRRYNQRLFRIARSIIPDTDIAETVVQEAYLLAFSDIERYEPTGKFGAWLARLAFNQALALRRTTRPVVISPAIEPALPAEGTAAPSDLEANGELTFGGSSDATHPRQLLERAIDGLPEVFRTVFVLRVVEGISGIETAACLGINETTVRTRLYRAQRRLGIDWSKHVPAERTELFELTSERGDYIVSRVLVRLNGTPRSQQDV
jgi:RNA polymerase sigma-70 factor, ECF subfamily